MSGTIAGAGTVIMVIGWVWSMIVGFRIHVGWFAGIALLSVMVIPIVAAKHWAKMRFPFSVWAGGWVVLIANALLSP